MYGHTVCKLVWSPCILAVKFWLCASLPALLSRIAIAKNYQQPQYSRHLVLQIDEACEEDGVRGSPWFPPPFFVN